jgi:epoxide hydrolase-like predicted phosphatase
MTIRAVFFDFGGVLYRTPDRHWMRQWQVLLGLGKDDEISSIIASPDESPFVQAIMDGRIPEDELWERIGRHWKLSPFLVSWLRRNAMSRRRLNQEVARFLGSLRPRYKTAILSNAGSDTRRIFTDLFGFDRLVDSMIISAEERVSKPDERIYRIALERLQVDPEEAVFLDDLAVNVAAANQLGMKAVHFRETRQALAEVQSLLSR